ncbi:MAG: hypothetical protein V1839_02530 [archaeon]
MKKKKLLKVAVVLVYIAFLICVLYAFKRYVWNFQDRDDLLERRWDVQICSQDSDCVFTWAGVCANDCAPYALNKNYSAIWEKLPDSKAHEQQCATMKLCPFTATWEARCYDGYFRAFAL